MVIKEGAEYVEKIGPFFLFRIAMELRSAEKQVKMQRRARLLELYKREALE